MNNIRDTYYMLMVQYQPGEGAWSLYHVFEDYTEAKMFMHYAISMDIKAKYNRVYKIFTYKLDKKHLTN